MKLILFLSKLIKNGIYLILSLFVLICLFNNVYFVCILYFRDLDFINLMSYDFYGSWEVIIGYYSVFYGCFGEVGMVVLMNVVWFFKSDGGFLFYMGYEFLFY